SCVQTITVQDTNAPSIACPASVTLNCPADTRTNVTGVATATDTCSSLSISYSDVTNSGCGGTYTILRTWTATDACTNSASCVQTITVRDTNAPSITCPAGVTLNCPADTRTNATGVATATDTCSSLGISYSDVTNSGCGGSYTILRTWTATDACTNKASCVQTITVQDTNPPSIICPAGVTLNCPADTRTNATGVATATDTCSSLGISYSDVTNSGCGGSYTILRTWTATDACTNHASCVQTITVQDTNPLSITCPAGVTLNCPADTRTNATGVATATDTCSSLTISYSDVTNSGCGGSYTILRTWTATDACTNKASCVQTITVQDTNPPSITCPAGV